ncbi:serine-rich adhesin for platelets [Eupeodes corollae]|uniref:serine-rich adhesin for platelets n=1 Tax=Eupeodes corollae TaxID=290404 RepID=UPI00249372A3|nr:serine-rich adhesin for platelets [Eupeodes corollae]
MKSHTKKGNEALHQLPLVLLFFVSCHIGFSESNTTPTTSFHSSISPAAVAYISTTPNEDIQPFTDVPLINSNSNSLSVVDVTRNPTVVGAADTDAASQIKMSDEVATSSTTTDASPSSSSSLSSSSSSSLTSSSSSSSSSSSFENTSSMPRPTTVVSSSIPSTDPLEIREPISNQPETDQENTDERPPPSSTILSGAPSTSTSTSSVAAATTPIKPLPVLLLDLQTPSSSFSTSIAASTMNKTNDPLSMTTTHETLINDIHVEKKLGNGLYRIKLAEIITDQFNGGINQHLDAPNENYISSQQSKIATDAIEAPASGGKINIIDLYPLKLEDFNPIIRNSNEKLIREKNIYLKDTPTKWNQYPAGEDDDRNMFPNSLDINTPPIDARDPRIGRHQDDGTIVAATIITRMPSVNRQKGEITDFTGKLLQEKDGVITEIEKKFRFDEFEQSTTKSTPILSTTSKSLVNARPRLMVNHQIEFIDRRVKKSFDFPLHHEAASRVGFSNTKFKTDNAKTSADTVENHHPADAHPEFSTTKFYNSKELYNEMLQRRKLSAAAAVAAHATTYSPVGKASSGTKGDTTATNPTTTTTDATVGNLHSTTTSSQLITESNKYEYSNPRGNGGSGANQGSEADETSARSKALKRVKIELQKSFGPQVAIPLERETNTPKDNPRTNEEKSSSSSLASASLSLSSSSVQMTSPSLSPSPSPQTSMNNKLEVRSSFTSSSTGVSLTPTQSNKVNSERTIAPSLSSKPSTPSQSSSTPIPNTNPNPNLNSNATPTPYSTVDSQSTTTGPTKASKSKPISRPRILSRLQEKINSLECDIQTLPSESHIWRGNETHELMLPVVTPENCKGFNDCTPMLVSWEGDAEIQSGDVLLVEINDASLYPYYENKIGSGHTTQVYQVTRSGHEHCDVTEGILLDITPLVVDGRKLVTLYDKDLTEGINLLIVVSELWGPQCIRLKVTMKSDNCGENADCSGKGICYSNDSMEGYECQCCGGFAGPHCEEIDACSPSPCTNNGICVDLSQGHEGNAYQCLCPYGYTGKNCQYESDPCNPAECMNGGSCVGNSSHFRCDCAPGYTGPLCQHNLNECESSPCVHGICVDQEDGFRCFCQPGFAGELCNFEYNECESNPCLNGAECIDQIGSFECRCSKGYIGSRCEIKVDFCANKPCPEGHRCIDHGDDFSCECPGGRNGPDCNQIPRTQCNVNPCTHGGTCWSSGDSFYCACRPGYTGTMCEDEFVVETVVSSSEFMVDDTSARNFNDKAFGSVVLKSPIELHNAYIAAGVLAAAIFIVAVVVTICHCKVNQTYRKFSTRPTSFFPILGFGRRGKSQKSHKHWLSGKAGSGPSNGANCNGNPLKSGRGHVPGTGSNQYHSQSTTGLHQPPQQAHTRPFQRHLAMNLENDMYYTVDFSEHSQHSPLIQ